MAGVLMMVAGQAPWTEEPGGLPSMGSHRVGHDLSDLASADIFGCCIWGALIQTSTG